MFLGWVETTFQTTVAYNIIPGETSGFPRTKAVRCVALPLTALCRWNWELHGVVQTPVLRTMEHTLVEKRAVKTCLFILPLRVIVPLVASSVSIVVLFIAPQQSYCQASQFGGSE